MEVSIWVFQGLLCRRNRVCLSVADDIRAERVGAQEL